MAEKKPVKKTTEKKPAAKKPAAKKPAAKKGDKKAKAPEGVTLTKAESRSAQEEGSIAPPTTQLVDAFAKYRQTSGRKMASKSTVARLAPGAALPRPPVEEKKPHLTSTFAPTAPAQIVPAAPVPPAAPAPVAAAPAAPVEEPVEAPAPAPAPAPAAKEEAPAAEARPEPKATYTFDATPQARAPMRPAPMPTPRSGPKPSQKKKLPLRSEPVAEAPAAVDAAPQAVVLKKLEVNTMVTVRELAEKMSASPNALIKKLIGMGMFVTVNQRLDSDTAILVAADFGYDLSVKALAMEEEIGGDQAEADKPEDLKPRPPVVTVMGHVDHGKTSLLDAIREADVVSGESGGITQHIGAYKVHTPKGDIAFLDTPGHEAFTAMRSRGAKVTDIVILVVSAADGIQPQTVEAIDHAKEAKVPIIVAVNKIDLPGADPQRVRTELAGRGLNPEEWGGTTVYVDISAKKRLNIDKLLEMVLLQAEVLELKANPDRHGSGTVVEAQMDKQRGTVATVLVQKGTIRVGDSFVMGLAGGKIKALINEHGERVKEAGPSTPVEILGITGNIPEAGDTFAVVESERLAKDIILKRNRINREESLAHKHHVSLTSIAKVGKKELPVIVKADVQGSVEVLKDSLERISTEEIRVRVIHAGLGNATEADVMLASASDAIILMFHVKADARATAVAEKEGIEIRRYEIIYELTQDVRAALEGLLEPEEVEVPVGVVEIRQEFKIRGTRVAGCAVVEGKAVRGAVVKILRDGAPVGTGKLEVLKRFKDEAKEVEKGHECGISISGFEGWKAGDSLQVVVLEKRVRRLAPSA